MITKRIRQACLIGTLLFCKFSFCSADDVEPPAVGNFALPNSQQPGPLISFGQNVIDKNGTQVFLFLDDAEASKSRYVNAIPSLLYGITDTLSIFVSIPYAAHYQFANYTSSGLEDISAQLEYTYYAASTHTYTDQATIVLSAAAPTGSINKNPATGNGSASFFVGTTFNRTYTDWLFFASPGVDLTTAHQGTKPGNSYLYQVGFGRNITDANGWILAWMIEVDGTYAQHDRFKGILNVNSGGNVVFVTPSIWASTKRFIFQLGVGAPAIQNLYGQQAQNNWAVSADLGWAIN